MRRFVLTFVFSSIPLLLFGQHRASESGATTSTASSSYSGSRSSPGGASSGGNSNSGGNYSSSRAGSSSSGGSLSRGASSRPNVTAENFTGSPKPVAPGSSDVKNLAKPENMSQIHVAASIHGGVQLPIVLPFEKGRDLNTAPEKGRLNSAFRQEGEPNKQAYRRALTVEKRGNATKRPNLFVRFFSRKAGDANKPCKKKPCQPIPPPVPVCPPDFFDAQHPSWWCVPWGNVDHCAFAGCIPHFASVNLNYCDEILNNMKWQESKAASLAIQRIIACSADAQSSACASANKDYQALEARITQLGQQHQMCIVSALSSRYGNNRGWTASLPPPSAP